MRASSLSASKLKPSGFCAEVEEDAPALHHRLDVDQNIHNRRAAGHLARVEGPLVALEEDHRIHLAHRVEIFRHKLTRVGDAIRFRADEARNHLHIRAGDVPAELDRRHAVLRLRQALRLRARQQRQANRAGMHVGIDAGLVQTARPAHGEDDVFREVGFQILVGIERERADNAFGPVFVYRQKLHHISFLAHGDVQLPHAANQRPAHLPRGVRPDGRGALAWIVIRLVADELPVSIAGERHAQVHQMDERPRRQTRFDERQVAVHAAALEVRLRHHLRRIGILTAQRELVVRLLVAAGVDRRALVQPLADDEHVFHAVGAQLHRGVQPRRPAPDDEGVNAGERYDLTGNVYTVFMHDVVLSS